MTEVEAYKMLGWPTEGAITSFVLPAGDELKRTDWCVTVCEPCNWRGISAPALLEKGCPACEKPWTRIIEA